MRYQSRTNYKGYAVEADLSCTYHDTVLAFNCVTSGLKGRGTHGKSGRGLRSIQDILS